jgi:23S rRNA (adenine-N6)-dimethyltransferase
LEWPLPGGPFFVVANIPYAITTPILTKILDPREHLTRGALLVERGAARRFTHERVLDPLILTWRIWFQLTMAWTVPRTAFRPAPHVDSAVLVLDRIVPEPIPPRFYARMLAFTAFGLRGPGESLREIWRPVYSAEQLTRVLRSMGRARDEPAASLAPDEWAILFSNMVEHVHPSRWPRGR